MQKRLLWLKENLLAVLWAFAPEKLASVFKLANNAIKLIPSKGTIEVLVAD
jgi:hypothetical protein